MNWRESAKKLSHKIALELAMKDWIASEFSSAPKGLDLPVYKLHTEPYAATVSELMLRATDEAISYQIVCAVAGVDAADRRRRVTGASVRAFDAIQSQADFDDLLKLERLPR